MKADKFSRISLYGDRKIFQKMLEKGCDKVRSGRGPWIGSERIVHIFAFSCKGKIIATLEQRKYNDGSNNYHGELELKEWPKGKAGNYLKDWKVILGPEIDLGILLKKWD